MTDTMAGLRRKIDSAGDLQSVVRSMKAMAAANITQYNQSVLALADYYRIVQLGLGACFREDKQISAAVDLIRQKIEPHKINVVVFGSDQGLVGQFNTLMADFVAKSTIELSTKPRVWAVGERVGECLTDVGLKPVDLFAVPNSVKAISILVGKILVECGGQNEKNEPSELYLFYNRPKAGALYEPVKQRLLPLDETWRHDLANIPWPTKALPEIMGDRSVTLGRLIHEYLFVSLFQASADSLASENASRLAAMQRAENNIDDLLKELNGTFHRLRQSSIDEELFDVIAAFDVLS